MISESRARSNRNSARDDLGIRNLDPAGKARLRSALEAAGAVFMPENGGGVGVRLKFTRTEAKRIAVLEGEGGIVASDDVP